MRWETERPFDVQLCHEYVYQKFLKLDNPSSSYDKTKFGVFMPHSVAMVIVMTLLAYCCAFLPCAAVTSG